MILYHGGTIPIDVPRILKSERMLDFGEGFYTTSNEEQAKRWSERVAARRNLNAQVISEYAFDIDAAMKNLTVVTFEKPDGRWLDFVCQNRSGRVPPIPYDIAIGPVANDQVYTIVTLFEQGLLQRKAAITELKSAKTIRSDIVPL